MPKVYYVNSLPFNYNGVSTPFGIFITKRNKGNRILLEHELIHYHQQQKGGLFFYFDYIKEHLINGYDNNKYEIEARIRESEYCKKNYTECMRNGKSKTSYNPNFRK